MRDAAWFRKGVCYTWEMQRRGLRDGKAVLGIEFGSTRIKAVLVDGKCKPIASGSHEWENRLEHGYWTYSLEDIWAGLQDAYKNLKEDVQEKYQQPLKRLGALGFSGMMHGYMAFDAEGKTSGSVPHLAEYDDRRGSSSPDESL